MEPIKHNALLAGEDRIGYMVSPRIGCYQPGNGGNTGFGIGGDSRKLPQIARGRPSKNTPRVKLCLQAEPIRLAAELNGHGHQVGIAVCCRERLAPSPESPISPHRHSKGSPATNFSPIMIRAYLDGIGLVWSGTNAKLIKSVCLPKPRGNHHSLLPADTRHSVAMLTQSWSVPICVGSDTEVLPKIPDRPQDHNVPSLCRPRQPK